MSHLLALEWDAREARLVIARKRGKSAVIEHALTIDLKPKAASASAPSPTAAPGSAPAPASATPASTAGSSAGAEGESVAAKIAQALRERGVTRVETLVAIGRASIELRTLQVPMAPPEELPDLVRFQAIKQFSNVGDSWPLDFTPLESSPDGPLNVLAASVSPDLMEQIRATCSAAQLTPKRVVLRPYAAASLWQRHSEDKGCVLMVDLLSEDADLTVLVDGHVGFMRTLKLPAVEEPEELAKAMFGEIRRTLAAASNQLGKRVERVVLCGDSADHTALRQLLTQQLNLSVALYDPFEGLELAESLAAQHPVHSGRYAPLLGLVIDEAAGTRAGIDFLNPRRRPEPPNHRRAYTIAGSLAAVVALVGVWLVWSQYSALDERIDDLKKQVADADAQLRKKEPNLRLAQELDEFIDGDVTWLDEMHYVSKEFPSAETALATQMSFMALPRGGGQMIVEGYVRQSGDIDDLENKLRDDQHKVSGFGGQYDARRNPYVWQFKETIGVVKPTVAELSRKRPSDATKNDATKADAASASKKPDSKATEPAAEKTAGKTAEKAAEKATEKATEKAEDMATERNTEKNTEKARDGTATEKPSEKPAEGATKEAVEKATEKAAEKSVEKPAVEKPAGDTTDKSRKAPSTESKETT